MIFYINIETFSTQCVENLYYQLGHITMFLFLSLIKRQEANMRNDALNRSGVSLHIRNITYITSL